MNRWGKVLNDSFRYQHEEGLEIISLEKHNTFGFLYFKPQPYEILPVNKKLGWCVATTVLAQWYKQLNTAEIIRYTRIFCQSPKWTAISRHTAEISHKIIMSHTMSSCSKDILDSVKPLIFNNPYPIYTNLLAVTIVLELICRINPRGDYCAMQHVV